MDLNAEDGGNRKWICVQLDEKTDEESEAHKAGHKTISDIAKERIRRAGKKVGKGDSGFKVLKVGRLTSKYGTAPSRTQPNSKNKWNLCKTSSKTESVKKTFF